MATRQNVLDALNTRSRIDIFKNGTAGAASTWTSLWTVLGTPVIGAAPASTTGVVCTSSTTGSLTIPSPAGGKSLYLARFQGNPQNNIPFFLNDRLIHCDGLLGNTTSAQTIGTPSLTRYTSGVGVEIWLEFYGAWTSTSVNVTVSYTNSAGTPGCTTTAVAIPANTAATRMILLPWQTGDVGCQSVQSLTLSGSAGSVGNYGVTLMKNLGAITPVASADPTYFQTALEFGLPLVNSAACVFLQNFGTLAGAIYGYLDVVEL